MDNLGSHEEHGSAEKQSNKATRAHCAVVEHESIEPLPSVSELRQCQEEVGALLKIIAELNAKMGSLQAPGEDEDSKSQSQAECAGPDVSISPSPRSIPRPALPASSIPGPGLNPSSPPLSALYPSPSSGPSPSPSPRSPPSLKKATGRSSVLLSRSGPQKVQPHEDSNRCCDGSGGGGGSVGDVDGGGGDGVVWADLQEALFTLERSASRGRALVLITPQPRQDEETQSYHLSAARESWVKATQVLEEMERELGFSYRSALPSEEKLSYQRQVLELHTHNSSLRSALYSRQQELGLTTHMLSELEDEKKKLQEKLLVLKRRWLVAGSLSPPCSPSSSSSGAVSPSWASPPFPGSPLLLRRHIAAFPPITTGGDLSPSSPCPSPSPSLNQGGLPGSPSLESETDRLQRCLERLKARNERLAAALERRKGESEQISMVLSRHEADDSALQMALQYCKECEETYTDLLGLYEQRTEQSAIAEVTEFKGKLDQSAQGDARKWQSLQTTLEGATQRGKPSSRLVTEEDFCLQVLGLKEKIGRLRRERATLHIPEKSATSGAKMSPDTGTLAGPRSFHTTSTSRGEKAALLYELVTVREEMSELRGAIRLTEKEKRCLEWTLMAQRAQDEAGALLLDNLKQELEEGRSMGHQSTCNFSVRSLGGGIPGPRNRTLLRELQAVMQRELLMKRRMVGIRESLDTKLSDCMALRQQGDEDMARLTHAHSKISSVFRSTRRKHHEQMWRLEKQVAALSEHHSAQISELQTTLESLEERREETVL